MVTAINTPTTPTALAYWNMLKDASDTVKIELISLISMSMIHKDGKSSSTETRNMLAKYAGMWRGEESADEIMATIRENQTIREPITF